jgi:hypothetical protein
MTLDLEVNEVEVKVLTSLASVTWITARNLSFQTRSAPHLRPTASRFSSNTTPSCYQIISEEEVKDKSKESSFTKLVVFVQAAWFCLSCIARISQRLPVSLLELNTFAHALYTLIVYVLWWKKPLNIEQPLLIHEDRMRPLLAYTPMRYTLMRRKSSEMHAHEIHAHEVHW